MKLFIMFTIGLLLISAGINQNLGSLLGSLIDPANMIDHSASSGSSGNFGS